MRDRAWHAAAMAGLLAAGLAAGCATAFESTVDADAGAQDSRPPNPDVGEMPIDAGVDPIDAADDDASLPWYPTEWHAPAHLCQTCDGTGDLPDPVTYNLALDGFFEPGSGATAVQALAAAEATGVFQAFQAASMVTDIVAVLYPRQVGAFDPSVAEWIVIVNGQ
jgi:hypothetical protein